MEHKFLETSRGNVHYWISKSDKSSECIIFTHGLTANHIMFEKQVEFFKDNYTILTWDVPLHGKSKPYKGFSYENAASDLKSIVERENLDNIILVGMSMGGYPSQEFAFRYPEKVKGFVALDTTPFGLGYYSNTDKLWLRKVDSIVKLYTEKFLKESMAKSVSRTKYAYELMKRMLKNLSKEEIVNQIGIAYGGFLKENKNVKLKCPVLILLGEHDKTGKVKQYCCEWSQKENYPLHVIKGAAHLSNADNYDAVNSEIKAFLDSLANNNI